MTLHFDTSSPVRPESRRLALIDAIEGAEDEDETDWLEWKSELDLGERRHTLKIAVGILAMANRDPAAAQRFCGGWGYFVVGASPGGASGFDSAMDTADLESKLTRYLGAGDEAPRWDCHWVHRAGRWILIVEVDPPRQGDPIFPLCAAGEDAQDGTVYVRSGTRSAPAKAAQIRMLSRRAAQAAGHPTGPLISVGVDNGLTGVDPDRVDAAVDDRVREIADSLRSDAAEIAQQDQSKVDSWGDRAPRIFTGSGEERPMLDPQSRFDEFVGRLRTWADGLTDQLREGVYASLMSAALCPITVRVANLGPDHLDHVELRLEFPAGVKALVSDDDWDVEAPDAPPAFKPSGDPSDAISRILGNTTLLGRLPSVDMEGLYPSVLPELVPPAFRVIQQDPLVIEYDVGSLRPAPSSATVELVGFVIGGPNVTDLPLRWSATSPSVSGRAVGSIDVAITASHDFEPLLEALDPRS